MKKIIALMLVIGCIFALASCDNISSIVGSIPGFGTEDPGNDTNEVDNSEGIALIQSAIDASAPDVAEISVVLVSTLGKLNGEYTVTYNEDGSAVVDYSYELFNSFSEDSFAGGIKSVYSGVTTVMPDGTVTDELGGVASVEAVTFDITLDQSKLENIVLSANSISAKVTKDNTLSILGVALDYDADLVISVGQKGVASVAISYVSASGPVEIVSVYTYIEEEPEEETEEETEENEGAEEGAEGADTVTE